MMTDSCYVYNNELILNTTNSECCVQPYKSFETKESTETTNATFVNIDIGAPYNIITSLEECKNKVTGYTTGDEVTSIPFTLSTTGISDNDMILEGSELKTTNILKNTSSTITIDANIVSTGDSKLSQVSSTTDKLVVNNNLTAPILISSMTENSPATYNSASFGVSNNTGNSCQILYTHVGLGSTSNNLKLQLYNKPFTGVTIDSTYVGFPSENLNIQSIAFQPWTLIQEINANATPFNEYSIDLSLYPNKQFITVMFSGVSRNNGATYTGIPPSLELFDTNVVCQGSTYGSFNRSLTNTGANVVWDGGYWVPLINGQYNDILRVNNTDVRGYWYGSVTLQYMGTKSTGVQCWNCYSSISVLSIGTSPLVQYNHIGNGNIICNTTSSNTLRIINGSVSPTHVIDEGLISILIG